MVAEDLELTVETLRCKEDREAGGLVKKVCVVIFLVENRIYSEKVCPSFWLQISYHCHTNEVSVMTLIFRSPSDLCKPFFCG